MGLFGGMTALRPRPTGPFSALDPMAAAQGARQAASGQTGLLADPVAEGHDSGGGLMGFLRQAQQPGGFFERLNTFGATLQDTSDGGNRAAMIRQQAQQALAAQEQAAQRANINKMAQGLNLSPRDQLIFNANPEAFIELIGQRENDERDAAAKAAETEYLNTSRGVYRTGANPGWQEEFELEQPKPPEGMRWTAGGGLELIPGYAEGRSRVAGATRAPPRPRAAGRSGGGRPASPVNPAAVRWD